MENKLEKTCMDPPYDTLPQDLNLQWMYFELV